MGINHGVLDACRITSLKMHEELMNVHVQMIVVFGSPELPVIDNGRPDGVSTQRMLMR